MTQWVALIKHFTNNCQKTHLFDITCSIIHTEHFALLILTHLLSINQYVEPIIYFGYNWSFCHTHCYDKFYLQLQLLWSLYLEFLIPNQCCLSACYDGCTGILLKDLQEINVLIDTAPNETFTAYPWDKLNDTDNQQMALRVRFLF